MAQIQAVADISSAVIKAIHDVVSLHGENDPDIYPIIGAGIANAVTTLGKYNRSIPIIVATIVKENCKI